MNSDDRQVASLAFLSLSRQNREQLAAAMAREFVNLAIPRNPDSRIPHHAGRRAIKWHWSRPRYDCATFPPRLMGRQRLSAHRSRSMVQDRRCCPRSSSGGGTASGCIGRIFVTDRQPATAANALLVHRRLSCDSQRAGRRTRRRGRPDWIMPGRVDGAHLCARFPAKVRKLVLAGAPIDIAAGKSQLSSWRYSTPTSIFSEFVELGVGASSVITC